MYENFEMRKVFVAELIKYMAANEKIIVLDADLGKASGTIAIKDVYPDRHVEVGIAEANMTSIAAGLSSYGYLPFISSFTPFITRRTTDQVAVSCAYAKQNVRIIGTDPSIAAEYNGGTHMSMEDVAIMRSIPEIMVFEPVDKTMLIKAMPAILDYKGVMYIRLWRKIAIDVFDDSYKFDLFRGDLVKSGNDVTIITSGFMLNQAIKAEKILSDKGINAEIINIHTIKPIDKDIIINSVTKTGCAVVCENHSVIGGLYSAVCEVTSQFCPVVVKPVAVMDKFGQVGKLSDLITAYGLSEHDIVNQVSAVI